MVSIDEAVQSISEMAPLTEKSKTKLAVSLLSEIGKRQAALQQGLKEIPGDIKKLERIEKTGVDVSGAIDALKMAQKKAVEMIKLLDAAEIALSQEIHDLIAP